jgi:hypothetical protein
MLPVTLLWVTGHNDFQYARAYIPLQPGKRLNVSEVSLSANSQN